MLQRSFFMHKGIKPESQIPRLGVDDLLYEELLIITNNPLVKNTPGFESFWVEGDCREVIMHAYNLVASGHQLISHPLSGSIKPNQNPYKSIIITKRPGEVDIRALNLIGNCLLKTEEFMQNKIQIDLQAVYGDDLQLVDQDILLTALQSFQEGR
jgi:hypothetical protein